MHESTKTRGKLKENLQVSYKEDSIYKKYFETVHWNELRLNLKMPKQKNKERQERAMLKFF